VSAVIVVLAAVLGGCGTPAPPTISDSKLKLWIDAIVADQQLVGYDYCFLLTRQQFERDVPRPKSPSWFIYGDNFGYSASTNKEGYSQPQGRLACQSYRGTLSDYDHVKVGVTVPVYANFGIGSFSEFQAHIEVPPGTSVEVAIPHTSYALFYTLGGRKPTAAETERVLRDIETNFSVPPPTPFPLSTFADRYETIRST
jgi:hypothetical protein